MVLRHRAPDIKWCAEPILFEKKNKMQNLPRPLAEKKNEKKKNSHTFHTIKKIKNKIPLTEIEDK